MHVKPVTERSVTGLAVKSGSPTQAEARDQ